MPEEVRSDYVRAQEAALRLIARAEQNIFGLSRKLKKRGYEAACIQAVISGLCEAGLLDDRRYACLWLESRMGRSSSPWRLQTALRNRGIDQSDTEYAMQKVLDEDAEFQLLQRYIQKLKRKGKIKNTEDPASLQSIKYLLKSEGFSSSGIQRFLDEIN